MRLNITNMNTKLGISCELSCLGSSVLAKYSSRIWSGVGLNMPKAVHFSMKCPCDIVALPLNF